MFPARISSARCNTAETVDRYDITIMEYKIAPTRERPRTAALGGFTRNRFVRFVAGRLAFTAVTAIFVAVVVFFAIRLIPGDPALLILGLDSTPEERDELRGVMGLDRPLILQFVDWAIRVLGGDLGYAYSQSRDVVDVVAPALANTLLLGGAASLLAIVIGLVMGNLATSRSRILRRTTDWFEAIFLSAPQYTVALILLICFAVLLPLFPAGGLSSRGSDGVGALAAHLALPAISLALAPGAQMARSLKTSISALQSTELLPALEARGLSPLRLAVHSHHNALPPMITVLGIQVGGMLGGALFVEQIFSIPGLGALIVQSVNLRDYQLVQGVALVIALIFVLVLLVADVVNALLDPRIRVGKV
ncbi:ABC transporter permease [Labedella gwakjiensis]|uniref:ABC transporter permease n=2 Tax=Labedella gwakjiensis TaxID=390269 RepID=A0ABY0CCA2_9MICO|nr:ABC transporter permease [Labedella gwakjiensis]